MSTLFWPDSDPHSLHGCSKLPGGCNADVATGTEHAGSQKATQKEHRTLAWIGDFLDSCKKLGMPVAGAAQHEYKGVEVHPTIVGFTVTSVAATLASYAALAAVVNQTVRGHNTVAGIYGGEVGPHNGKSPPCNHTSMAMGWGWGC